jgi:hypothetical protein
MILPGCPISRGYAVRVQCFDGARRHGRVPRRNLIVTSAGRSSWTNSRSANRRMTRWTFSVVTFIHELRVEDLGGQDDLGGSTREQLDG